MNTKQRPGELDDTHAWRKRLLITFQSYKAERHRFVGLSVPAPSSDLWHDAQISNLETSHDQAWHALRVSDEHMHALHLVWQASNGGFAFISPQHTIARSALIAVAHAYWVLAPSDSICRAARSLLLARVDMNAGLSRYDDFLKDPAATDARPDLIKPAEEGRDSSKLAKRRFNEELSRLGRSAPDPKDTAIISECAKHLRDALPEAQDPLLLLAAMTAWRTSSAHAHGHQWQTRATAEIQEHPSGRLIQWLTPQLIELGQVAAFAHLLYEGAWRRFDQLGAAKGGSSFTSKRPGQIGGDRRLQPTSDQVRAVQLS